MHAYGWQFTVDVINILSSYSSYAMLQDFDWPTLQYHQKIASYKSLHNSIAKNS